jgi:hypothetical protein
VADVSRLYVAMNPYVGWQQLEVLVREPAQRTDGRVRPVVLFGLTPTERSRVTDAVRTDVAPSVTA